MNKSKLKKIAIKSLIIFIFLCAYLTAEGSETYTIETKYTWPRGQDQAHECELATQQAKNKANSFVRNNKNISVNNIEISSCNCKLGPDKLWGCKATATIEYEEHEEKSFLFEDKVRNLKNHIQWLNSDAISISENLTKLYNMPRLNGVISGFNLVSKYESRFKEMIKRVKRAKKVLDKIHSDTNSVLEETIDNILADIDNSENALFHSFNDLDYSLQRAIDGDFSRIKEKVTEVQNEGERVKRINNILANLKEMDVFYETKSKTSNEIKEDIEELDNILDDLNGSDALTDYARNFIYKLSEKFSEAYKEGQKYEEEKAEFQKKLEDQETIVNAIMSGNPISERNSFFDIPEEVVEEKQDGTESSTFFDRPEEVTPGTDSFLNSSKDASEKNQGNFFDRPEDITTIEETKQISEELNLLEEKIQGGLVQGLSSEEISTIINEVQNTDISIFRRCAGKAEEIVYSGLQKLKEAYEISYKFENLERIATSLKDICKTCDEVEQYQREFKAYQASLKEFSYNKEMARLLCEEALDWLDNKGGYYNVHVGYRKAITNCPPGARCITFDVPVYERKRKCIE